MEEFLSITMTQKRWEMLSFLAKLGFQQLAAHRDAHERQCVVNAALAIATLDDSLGLDVKVSSHKWITPEDAPEG